MAGAELALGPDSVKKVFLINKISFIYFNLNFKILKGQFLIEDYDFCVAHEDVAKEILPLRGVLKSRFPNKNNGSLFFKE
jgi:hypothetical protein